MPSGRERKIKREKRQEMWDRRQQNRIVQMLNQQKAAETAATTTLAGTATVPGTDPTTMPGGPNDPTARAGLEGNYIPSKAGQTLPQWYQGMDSRTPAARKGLTGTGSGLPAWVPDWMNRKNLARGLTGLGVASSLMPMFGGTLTPAWMALARLANGNQGQAAPNFGGVNNRYVSPDTGMPSFDMLPTQTGPQLNFGGGNSWWNPKRKKGGGGRPRTPWAEQTYQPKTYQDFNDEGPAWGRGLANWSIG